MNIFLFAKGKCKVSVIQADMSQKGKVGVGGNVIPEPISHIHNLYMSQRSVQGFLIAWTKGVGLQKQTMVSSSGELFDRTHVCENKWSQTEPIKSNPLISILYPNILHSYDFEIFLRVLWDNIPVDLKSLNVFNFSKKLKHYLLSEQHSETLS